MRLYIKKYVIEFLVIFISITSSFVVEEWRTNKQERKVSKEFLQRLKAELDEKTSQTQQYLVYTKKLHTGFEKIALNFKTREIKDDSLFQYIIDSEGGGSINPELATWESLKSSGVFASIKPEIIDSVNSLLKTYKHLNTQNKYLNDLTLLTWPLFLADIPSTEVTDQWISFFQKHNIPLNLKQSMHRERVDLNKLLNNPVAIDYYFTKTLLTIGILDDFKSLPEKEKRLIALIEKEIAE